MCFPVQRNAIHEFSTSINNISVVFVMLVFILHLTINVVNRDIIDNTNIILFHKIYNRRLFISPGFRVCKSNSLMRIHSVVGNEYRQFVMHTNVFHSFFSISKLTTTILCVHKMLLLLSSSSSSLAFYLNRKKYKYLMRYLLNYIIKL